MQNKTKLPFFVILVLCVGVLWYFQSQITVNIPWWDDFHGIMLPVYTLFSDQTFFQKFDAFVSLNNEHRVVNDRIFMTIIYLIFGKFEMKYLAMLGFINLIGIFILYFKVAKENTRNYFFFLPIVFLIFHAQYYESLQSLMVPFQNFSVILYTFLSFYYLIYKKNNRLLPAGIFATLALFTHGNGGLAFVIGALILAFYADYKALTKWALYSCLCISLYFINYEKPSWTQEKAALSYSIWDRIKYGFEFLGAYFQIPMDISTSLTFSPMRAVYCSILGFILVIVFLFIFLKKYSLGKTHFSKSLHMLKNNKKDVFLLATLSFFAATAILMAYSRTGLPMMSRYTINSAFCIISLYLFIIFSIKNQKVFNIFSIIFTGICLLLSYFNYTDIAIYKKNNSVADGINWQQNGRWANQYSDSAHVERLNPLLVNIYTDAKYEFPKNEIDAFKSIDPSGEFKNLKINNVKSYLEITGQSDSEIYFSLESKQNSFVFPIEKISNNIVNFIKTSNYYSNSYKVYFPLKVVPKADYKLFILMKTNKGFIKKLVSNTIPY